MNRIRYFYYNALKGRLLLQICVFLVDLYRDSARFGLPSVPSTLTATGLSGACGKRGHLYGSSERAAGVITLTHRRKLLPTASPLVTLKGRLYPASWLTTTLCTIAPAGLFLTSWHADRASPLFPYALSSYGSSPVCSASENFETGME